jgi:hypothetical protein
MALDDAGYMPQEYEDPAQQQGAVVDRERIKRLVLSDIKRARDYYESKVQQVFDDRHALYTADRDYYAKRFPIISKQSDFVSYDFWSVVQWALPTIMNSFTEWEALKIMGRSAEDVHRAEIMAKLIKYQLFVQNKGFLTLWDWFNDAFEYNLGALKVWWKRVPEWITVNETLPVDRIMAMVQDPNIQIMNMGQPDMFGSCAVSYQVMRLKANHPVIETIQVTDLRWSPEARSIEDANMVAHRRIVSTDHLRRQAQEGVYDPDAVERAVEKDALSGVQWTTLDNRLNDELQEIRQGGQDEDPARALHELYECYMKVDLDGDGMLEDAIITIVGEEILRVSENPWGRVPIFLISPVRDPYKILATISFAEIIGEVQSLKTAMMRQMIVNLSRANNPQFFIDSTGINNDDLRENKQFIRSAGPPGEAVAPFPQAQVASWTLPFFELLENSMEQWTGRTRYNQGQDSRSLNKTATGISLLTRASEQRIDYIVRVFAETGVSEAMRFLIKLNQMYIDQPQVIRLSNEMLPVSPDDLSGDFDIDVNTEAGIGTRQQITQNLQLYLSMLAPAGLQIGAITPIHWAQAAAKLLEESGIRDPQRYVASPEEMQQMMMLQQLMQMQAAQNGGGNANGNGNAGTKRPAAPAGGARPPMAGGGGGAGGIPGPGALPNLNGIGGGQML